MPARKRAKQILEIKLAKRLPKVYMPTRAELRKAGFLPKRPLSAAEYEAGKRMLVKKALGDPKRVYYEMYLRKISPYAADDLLKKYKGDPIKAYYQGVLGLKPGVLPGLSKTNGEYLRAQPNAEMLVKKYDGNSKMAYYEMLLRKNYPEKASSLLKKYRGDPESAYMEAYVKKWGPEISRAVAKAFFEKQRKRRLKPRHLGA